MRPKYAESDGRTGEAKRNAARVRHGNCGGGQANELSMIRQRACTDVRNDDSPPAVHFPPRMSTAMVEAKRTRDRAEVRDRLAFLEAEQAESVATLVPVQ